jgi:hypothetical protein
MGGGTYERRYASQGAASNQHDLRLSHGISDRLAIVPQEGSPRHPSLFTLEEIEYAVTRAGQLVYGSDERLDHLVNETRRLLKQGASSSKRRSRTSRWCMTSITRCCC